MEDLLSAIFAIIEELQHIYSNILIPVAFDFLEVSWNEKQQV
jgi:hypothetical protein